MNVHIQLGSDADLSSIVLIPSAGDPHGLLREGRCGAKAPTVHSLYGQWTDAYPREGTLPAALALWWRGEIVPEGCDRVQRALMAANARISVYEFITTRAGALAIGENAEDFLGCTVELLARCNKVTFQAAG